MPGIAVLGLACVVGGVGGDLRLLRWAELPSNCQPATDQRTSVWDTLHSLLRALLHQSAALAGSLLARMSRAHRERVNAWSSIKQAANQAGVLSAQPRLDG